GHPSRPARKPVPALDPDRHARRRPAVRAQAGTLRDDPVRPRSRRVALPLRGGVHRARRGARGRPVQPQRSVRVRFDRALPPHARIDRALQPAGGEAGVLESAGAARQAGAHGRTPPPARRSLGAAAPDRPDVLLQRVPRGGGAVTVASAAIHPWIGVAVILGAFVLLFAGVAVYARAGGPPEITRKLVHAGSGILTLAFPFLFRDAWPVLLLTGASAALIAAIKFMPALRRRFGGAVSGVDRSTLGELYFPVSVALVFWLTRGAHPLLFVIPILVLTLADATCA